MQVHCHLDFRTKQAQQHQRIDRPLLPKEGNVSGSEGPWCLPASVAGALLTFCGFPALTYGPRIGFLPLNTDRSQERVSTPLSSWMRAA